MSPQAAPAAQQPTAGNEQLEVGASLRRDLFRLGVIPCAAVALALTGWFTQSRLDALESAFDTEGQAVARQVAAMSDLSLYAGDLPALQNVANAALRGGQVTRVEISNSAGVYVTAGPQTASLARLRIFTAPVTLREASRASAFAPAGSTAAGERPIGLVQAFRDTTPHAQERTRSLMAGIGMAAIALLAAWAWVRHTARAVAQPLRLISRTVAALEAGRFDARCNLVSRPAGGRGRQRPAHELASLADDINRLAERLQRNRERTDEQVREATAVEVQRMTESEQAALSRTRFLAAASHDLRQPLHAMGLFIDGLLPTATAAQRPAVLRLQEGTEFMGVLLDDLLEI
ncbi:MAG: histidine kinase dimerization/phospho-acceptor domain-containing protein, partial [Variovorax sp.]